MKYSSNRKLTCLTIIASTLLLASTQVSAFSLHPTTIYNHKHEGELATNPVRSKQSHLHMMDASPIQFIAEAYSNSLEQYPFVTKGTTGFFLCGIGDVLAQVQGRESSPDDQTSSDISMLEQINWPRLARFATKGFFGTSIWAAWYDYSDYLLNSDHILTVLQSAGIIEPSNTVKNMARTGMLIILEQFVFCPIIYGIWEIPVSTLLNGAPPSRIQYEVKDKLGDMLIENAKVWTLANIFIYNAPLQYRTAMANVMDIIWQSIVSDFAADCGNGDKEDVDIGFKEGLVVAMNDESLELVGNKAMMNGAEEKVKINTATRNAAVKRQRLSVL
jgi:hypothetical protein